MQLQPKTYDYINSSSDAMNLPTSTQRGFMAQEVALVMPELVQEVQQPAEYDSQGNMTAPGSTFSALNYPGMVPYTVGAIQEIKMLVDQQTLMIQQLQAQVAQCCSLDSTDGRDMYQFTPGTGFETDLRIVPNPVAASTQLRYTVGTPGRVRLEVSDGMGRMIEVLEESTRQSGSYVYDWNTQQLSPGTYYCTLFVNDEPLVKKAVKLNDR
jgi:hypothetical protein